MSEFKKGISHAETRNLKKWVGGRLNQLALWVRHLETAFDVNSLAGQVLQSPKRELSEFVPKVVEQEIESEVEFREIRLAWKAPRGLRFFLFYELQVSLFSNFAQFDTFVTADPFFVFPNLTDGTTYYIRVRVINKDQLFGPWSETIAVTTPNAQAFGFLDTTESFAVVHSLKDFETIFELQYNSIQGSGYFGIDYELETFQLLDRISQTDVEIHWTLDGDQFGQNMTITTLASVDTGHIDVVTADIGTHETDSLRLLEPFFLNRKGSLFTPIIDFDSDSVVVGLRARTIDVHPTPNDWIQNPGFYPIGYTSSAAFTFKNFRVYDVLVG